MMLSTTCHHSVISQLLRPGQCLARHRLDELFRCREPGHPAIGGVHPAGEVGGATVAWEHVHAVDKEPPNQTAGASSLVASSR
jgi:hypothetical protein